MPAEKLALYELTGAYADAAAALMDCETDEEYAEALAAFDAIEAGMQEKALSMACALRNLQMRELLQKSYADIYTAEARRMQAKSKSTAGAIDRLKERVLFAMETAGLERIRTDAGTWYIGTSVSVDVQDPDQVPEEFVKRYTPEIDKAAIRKHFDATGEILPGTDVIQKRSARFR